MREKRERQLSLFHHIRSTEIGKELEEISNILDETPEILDHAYRDLLGKNASDNGRTGMSAEQVLRCTVLKQYRNLSYEELAFHLVDSQSFRAFARLTRGQKPKASTLQQNVKALGEATWEAINQVIIGLAARKGIEKGRTIRIDSTAVETDVHYPTDSTLLRDGIRVITRLLLEGKTLKPRPAYRFMDHRRVVKKRALAILDSKKAQQRRMYYKELLDIAARVRDYALEAIGSLQSFESADVEELFHARAVKEKLERAIGLLDKVMDQTSRRVMRDEKVPAAEKIVSFFETHTDIIEKGNRETTFGHKVFLVGGSSGLILDCLIERGNPTDSGMFLPMMERQRKLFRRVPRQVAADGGFASLDNLRKAKADGIQDVSFSKRKGLPVLEMVKSSWVYKKLRNFRAGIEANISVLKRAFGLTRCHWTGWDGFLAYVRSAIASYNLLVLARSRLIKA